LSISSIWGLLYITVVLLAVLFNTLVIVELIQKFARHRTLFWCGMIVLSVLLGVIWNQDEKYIRDDLFTALFLLGPVPVRLVFLAKLPAPSIVKVCGYTVMHFKNSRYTVMLILGGLLNLLVFLLLKTNIS
jgi:hypothetical protein